MNANEFTSTEVWKYVESLDILFNLYERWLCEKEYEDIDEYKQVIEKEIQGIIKMTKKPFGMHIRCKDKILIVEIKQKGNNIKITGKSVFDEKEIKCNIKASETLLNRKYNVEVKGNNSICGGIESKTLKDGKYIGRIIENKNVVFLVFYNCKTKKLIKPETLLNVIDWNGKYGVKILSEIVQV